MAVLPTRPFQNQSYSIAAASAFGNSFYAPAYLSSSPASRRSLETRKKLPPETTPAFATLRTSSIIRSPPFRHSLFLNTFHRFSLRTESSLTKLRRNAFSLFSPYRISHEWKIERRSSFFPRVIALNAISCPIEIESGNSFGRRSQFPFNARVVDKIFVTSFKEITTNVSVFLACSDELEEVRNASPRRV